MSEHVGQSVRGEVMDRARSVGGATPTPQLRSLVCPYCGSVTPDSGRCSVCMGRFDALSRQATQNQMGPWSIRDDRQPHRPGCTFDTIAKLISQDLIGLESVIRGPSTRQFWTLARHTPGVAHLLGVCYSCQVQVGVDAFSCPSCHAQFTAERDRQHLGLGPARPLPGQGLPEVLALKAEPAWEQGKGRVESTVITPRSPNPITGERRVQGAGKAPGEMAQSTEAAQLARRWKRAWEVERRRAWTVLIFASAIVLIAISYTLWATWRTASFSTGSQDMSLNLPSQ